jgi:hypothetical protein
MMRLLKVPLLTLLILFTYFGLPRAQIGCDDLVKSTIDTVRVVSTEGRPGDTVNIPILLKNDSIVTAFQMVFKFDTTWLTPVFIRDSTCTETDGGGNCITWSVDSNFIDYNINGRFVKTDTSGAFNDIIDTVTKFSANQFQDMKDVIACNFLPQFTDIDSLPGGRGNIFSIKFAVDENMPHLQLSQLSFYEADIFIVNDTVFPPETTFFGCSESQMSTVWFDGSETQTFQVYPTSNTSTPMFFRADTAFVPQDDPTISLTGSPNPISSGGLLTLSWNAANADSVVITGPASELPLRTIQMQSSINVVVPVAAGTYTYTATAFRNSGASAIDAVAIIVSGGGGGGGTAPSIAFTPPDLSYTIKQGETVSFTVFASEPDGHQITLTANSLPNNASFGPTNPVIGVSSVSGTFSFTPDFVQEGTFPITFSGSDEDGTTTRQVTIVVEELQIDRLFSTSAVGQQPVGGLPDAGGVYFPINLVTAKTVYGVQFDMFYPPGVVTVDSFVVTGRIPEYVVRDNIGVVPGNIRVVTLGLQGEPVGTDSTTAILWAVLTLADDAIPWTTHSIYLENGRESIDPNPDFGSLPLVTDSGIVEIDKYGDVNLDKIIDVADAVNIVAYILENYGFTRRQFDVADVITNDSVNVFDLVGVMNLIFGIPISPAPPPPSPTDTAVILLAYNDVTSGASDILTIASEQVPVELAGVQLEVSYDPETVELGVPSLTQYNENFALSYRDDGNGRMLVILYHGAPFKTDELIQTGASDLVYLPITARSDITSGDISQIRVSEALFSTSSSASINVNGIDRFEDVNLPLTFVLDQNYPNPFNPETWIAFSLSVGSNVDLSIFNVLGQHVKTLVKGEMEASQRHQVMWDATDELGTRVATGVYLYRLQVGDENQVRKMLLLK